MCTVIICYPVLPSQILKLKLTFLSSRVPMWFKTSGQKFKYLKNEKKLSIWNKKHSSSCLRGFNCQKMSHTWEWTLKESAIRKILWNKSNWKFIKIFRENIWNIYIINDSIGKFRSHKLSTRVLKIS